MTFDEYNKVFENLQDKLNKGEITLENAMEVNDLAYEKYLTEKNKATEAIKKVASNKDVQTVAKGAAAVGAGMVAGHVAKKAIKNHTREELASRAAKKNINTEIKNFRTVLGKTPYGFGPKDKAELREILSRISGDIESL